MALGDYQVEVTAVGIQGLSGAPTYVVVGATGPQGASGATGPQGEVGASGVGGGSAIHLLGSVGSSSSLDPSYLGSSGDAYITTDTNHLWVWDGSTWVDTGSIAGASGAVINGATGPQGIQGVQGASGLQGIQGASGATGTQGASGALGASGLQGSQGIQGASGATGTQGASGAHGASGAQGSQGIQGASGATGTQGASGSAGPQGASGLQGFAGGVGATGAQGASGARGATGLQGTQGIQGASGATGTQGASGVGATGLQGIQGASGVAGASGAAQESLVWTTSGTARILTGYRQDGTVTTVRVAEFLDNLLTLTLASFTPNLYVDGQSLAWDQPATGFTVTVDNPSDITDQWISDVSLIDNSSGVYTTLANYTTSGPSPTPGATIDWSQTFSTNGTAVIHSDGTGATGGSAGARITFKDNNNTDYTTSRPTLTYNWADATSVIMLSSLPSKIFLDYYSSIDYTVIVSGIANSSNYVNTVSAIGGTPSNSTGSGTFTFTTGLHKDNNTGRSVGLSTVFTRPISVTGTSYSTTVTSSNSSITTVFTYPSFYYWTTNTLTPPTRADVVAGYRFENTVTQLEDQTNTLSGFINNSDSNPRAFWFAVRTSATQPTTFQTGPSSGLLSDVSVTTGNTILLQPDSPLSGYTAESYTLYGITLQPGNTYVSIS